jgi:hypothetical protein
MKKLKRYIEYLKEDLIENNPLGDLQLFIEGLKINIEKWYENKELTNCENIDIDITNFGRYLDKILILNFDYDEYNFRFEITVRPEDYINKELSKIFIKIIKRDPEDKTDTYSTRCTVEELNPEFILSKVDLMIKEPQGFGKTGKSKSEDNPVQLETPTELPGAVPPAQGGEITPAQGAPAF